MIASLPCSSCTARCCGPVPLSAARLEKIRAYMEKMPRAERDRLQQQKRSSLDCGFLDMETMRCAIYPVRPWVCKAFGQVEGMQCPKVTGLVQIIPAIVAEVELEKEYESGIAGLSNAVEWVDT